MVREPAWMTQTDAGYSIHHHVFVPGEMTRALDALAVAQMERTRAGARHVLKIPIVRELAEDRRLMAIASHFLGAAPMPFRATLFDKSPRASR